MLRPAVEMLLPATPGFAIEWTLPLWQTPPCLSVPSEAKVRAETLLSRFMEMIERDFVVDPRKSESRCWCKAVYETDSCACRKDRADHLRIPDEVSARPDWVGGGAAGLPVTAIWADEDRSASETQWRGQTPSVPSSCRGRH